MAEVINLRRERKRKARAAEEALAAANRIRHGRTKAEKQCDAAEQQAAQAKLDQLRRETSEPD